MIIRNFSWDVRYYFSTANCSHWFYFHNLVLSLLKKNLNNFDGTSKYKRRHKHHLKKNLKFHFFKVQMRNLSQKIQKIKIIKEMIFFFSFKTIETLRKSIPLITLVFQMIFKIFYILNLF